MGFDWWMVWKWVSWGVSSTVVNVSTSTRPSSLRDSLVCIIASVFLQARSVNRCLHVLPNVGTVWGIQKVEWLWEWCRCRAPISPMPGGLVFVLQLGFHLQIPYWCKSMFEVMVKGYCTPRRIGSEMDEECDDLKMKWTFSLLWICAVTQLRAAELWAWVVSLVHLVVLYYPIVCSQSKKKKRGGSVRVQTDSMPTIQYPKKEVGRIMI